MADEDKWGRVRQIVREECERIEQNILAVLEKHGAKPKIQLIEGKFLGITAAQRSAWETAFPAVDIDPELNKAAAWILSNPTLAPKTQIARFLMTWLSRTQDRVSIKSIPTHREREEVKKKACAYCEKDATGTVGSIWHCRAHVKDAMEEKPRRMLGIVPKPVAGVD